MATKPRRIKQAPIGLDLVTEYSVSISATSLGRILPVVVGIERVVGVGVGVGVEPSLFLLFMPISGPMVMNHWTRELTKGYPPTVAYPYRGRGRSW